MIGRNTIKLIKSLADKKSRQETGLFLAEGNKLVNEILNSSFTVEFVIATPDFMSQVNTRKKFNKINASHDDIRKASLLKNPQQAIAVVHFPELPHEIRFHDSLILCLDSLQDPGNLGTIVRLADWFGIREIVCSPDTVDVYNPKTLQATMGAITRVVVRYMEPETFFTEAQYKQIKIYGSFPEGKSIYETELVSPSILVVGNEGKGIGKNLMKYFSEKLTIPNFSENSVKSESLNVSVATAVICSEFKRQENCRKAKLLKMK